MQKLAIIGAGAWGTALAYAFRGTDLSISIWSKSRNIVNDINLNKQNSKYTGGKILAGVSAATNLQTCLQDADVIINALPSYAIKDVFELALPFIKEKAVIINASKGIDAKTHKLPYQIFNQVMNEKFPYFTLSGPSFASGLLDNQPTAVNIAGINHSLINELSNIVRNNHFYFAYSSDIIGVEWGGIYKNIVAIAAGFAQGLGFDENTNALIFSAGIKEMIQSGITLGANLETFYQPCGVGDLMLSTSSMKSRNYSFGFHLAKESSLEKIFTKLAGIAEGYYTLQSISYLKNKYNIDLPLSDMLYEIIFKKADHKKSFIKFLETHFK